MASDLSVLAGPEVRIGSGALGTALHEGLAGGEPVEHLNLRQPDRVRALRAAYAAAGSAVLVTNTFGAHPLALAEAGLAGRGAEINRAGVRLAREAAAGACAVWASIGPLGLGLALDDYTDATPPCWPPCCRARRACPASRT